MSEQPVLRRDEIAAHILSRLEFHFDAIREQFHTPGLVPSCWVDGLLPEALARQIHESFPPSGKMVFKDSIRERKYIAAQRTSTRAFWRKRSLPFRIPGSLMSSPV